MCWTVKDLQNFAIVAAWLWVYSGPLLRDSKPEALWPNSLRRFPLALLKYVLILALKIPEMKVEG